MTTRVNLDKFDGGLQEQTASSAFVKQQHAELKGLVPTHQGTLRSQPGWQRIGSKQLLRFSLLQDSSSWLVGISSTGSVVYAKAPADTATAAQTAAVTWTTLLSATTSHRVSEPVIVETATAGDFRTGVVVSSATQEARWFVYENAAGTALVSRQLTAFPSTEDDGEGNQVPVQGSFPPGGVVTMWADFLVVGDTRRVDDDTQAFTWANSRRASDTIYVSRGGDPDAFDPISFIAPLSPGATIVGLVSLDVGLLVLTSDTSNRDGVVLLRGRPDNFVVDPLRGGLGLDPRLASSAAQSPHALWSDIGSVAFCDRSGRVWHTNGDEVVRLDDVGLTSPTPPAGSDPLDRVGAGGAYLLAYRGERALLGKLLGDAVVWSELVLPPAESARDILCIVGDEVGIYVCFSGGDVWRLNTADLSESGHANGVPLTLSWGSATLGAPRGHATKLWQQVGLRMRARTGATLVSVATYDEGVLAGESALLTTTLNRALSGVEEAVVPGHGPSRDFAFRVTVKGDVEFESAEVTARGGRKEFG